MPEQPSPPGAGGDSPQQAPMGVSSVSGPTPNKGYEAAAIQRLGGILNQLTEMLPMVGATSEIGSSIMKGIQLFAKHVPPGASSPASEQNNIQRMAQQNAQNMQMQQQMKPPQPGGGQAPPGGPPGMGASGMARAA